MERPAHAQRPTAPRPGRHRPPLHPVPRARFRTLDEYRVEREWLRYEGTSQRDLFRQLRVRFLKRRSVAPGWVLDIGPGPGRFTPFLGGSRAKRVVLDLSKGMLAALRRRWVHGRHGSVPELVLGDGVQPPFVPGGFHEVAALGNSIGFAGQDALRLLDRAIDLLAPGGTLLLETVAGAGERSRYLARLPAGAVARLLKAPVRAIVPRVEHEGFEPRPGRDPARHGFRSMGASELSDLLRAHDVEIVEIMAVAPALGSDPDRAARIATDPVSWAHLLDLEETLGRRPERYEVAAALLVAGVRADGGTPPAERTD